MKISALSILRIGLAITFIWIGIMILKDPEGWGAFLEPWARELLPISLTSAMIGAGIFDVLIGLLLLIAPLVWLGALLGSLHLLIILITSGINEVTVRDVGLLAGTLALMIKNRK
jgi:uncharacterized membrane protein YphA (DoxX/SURF4 family)